MSALTLVEAGRALGLSYPQALRLLMRGLLDGDRGPDGRWRITPASIERTRRTLLTHGVRVHRTTVPTA